MRWAPAIREFIPTSPFLRGGTLLGRSLLSGADTNGYFTTSMSTAFPGSIRGTVGASGNPDQILKDGILFTAGVVTQGSASVSGTTTQSVRLDLPNTEFHSWFNGTKFERRASSATRSGHSNVTQTGVSWRTMKLAALAKPTRVLISAPKRKNLSLLSGKSDVNRLCTH